LHYVIPTLSEGKGSTNLPIRSQLKKLAPSNSKDQKVQLIHTLPTLTVVSIQVVHCFISEGHQLFKS